MTQIKLRRDTSANFTSANPVLGVGEPAYETDTKKLKIGDGTTAYNSLGYFSMTDEFATYREKYGAPSDSVPVVNTGNSITIKAGVSIETPNGTLTNTTDMTYTFDFLTDRVLFATENDYYHAYAVYYGGREPSPVGEQIFWFNNNVWTMISGNGTKTVFNTQKITPIAKIYQVNGTVKNIDYSSYTKTSTGGGGSTNITATLPLKIVDGVISLEVDGQTIQIVDGKLHANLDELGNEVNDLSGRVTAAEADILTKENKITTTGALSLQEKIKSNAVGFTITSESAMTNDHYQRVPFPESQSARLYIQDASFTYPYKSYLAIPYSLGQVIRVPRAYGQLFFGSFDDNGDFIVSVGFNTFYYDTSGFALFGGPVYRAVAGSNEYPPVMPKLNPTQMGYDGNYTYKTPPREAADSGNLYGLSNYLPENDFSCAFYQISPDTTGAIMIQAFWSMDTGRCSTAVYRDTETSYQYAGHLDAMRNNIQYALWLPNETGTSYNPSKFGLYDWNVSRIPWGNADGWKAFFKGRGPNLYSLTGQSSKNYLELNLGDGLSVVDGKLTASSTAPSNMVTTDTNQDITGTKSFTTGEITFKNTDSNRKILGEINNNGFYCNYYIDKASGEKPLYLGKVAERVFNMGIPGLERVTGRIYANTLTKWNGSNEVGTILDSSNLASYVDGTTITYANNKLSATGGGSAPTNMVTTDTTQTITGRKTFGDKIIFNRPDSGASEQASILGGEFKLGTSDYDNSIYANQLLLNANTTNAGTFKVQAFSTTFTQINGATITSQRTGTGAYKIINTIRPSKNGSNKNYSVLYSEVDDSYNHKLTINNLSSDLVLAGKTVKDGSGNEFLTSGNVTAYVTEEFVDGTEGYRVWSNDYCEQWGTTNSNTSSGSPAQYKVTLLKTYKDASYQVYATPIVDTDGVNAIGILSTGRTSTQITFASKSNYSKGILWKAEGYIA